MQNNNSGNFFYAKQKEVNFQGQNSSSLQNQMIIEEATIPKNKNLVQQQHQQQQQYNLPIDEEIEIASQLVNNNDISNNTNVVGFGDIQNNNNNNFNILKNQEEPKFDLRKSQFYSKQKEITNNINEIQSDNFQYTLGQQEKQGYQNFIQEQQQLGNNKPETMLKSLYYTKNPADDYINTIKSGGHPYAIVFHCLFKFLALFFHLFLSWFIDQYTVYEIVIIMNAFDFWTVKNITGRLLVGLRWWSEPMPDGEDKWVFECQIKEEKKTNINDTVFWGVQGIAFVIWGVFLAVNILALDLTKSVTIIFALQTTGVNLFAYYKCSRVQKERIKDFATKVGADIAMKMMNQTVKLPMSW